MTKKLTFIGWIGLFCIFATSTIFGTETTEIMSISELSLSNKPTPAI